MAPYDPKQLDPKIKSEFGLKHLSHVNRILLTSVMDQVHPIIPIFKEKGIALQLHKHPAARFNYRLTTWVNLIFLRNPTINGTKERVQSFDIFLIEKNAPRKLSNIKAEAAYYLDEMLAGRKPIQKNTVRQKLEEFGVFACCCIGPFILALLIVLLLVRRCG